MAKEDFKKINDRKMAQLKAILDVIDGSVSKEEVLLFFEKVVKIVRDVEASLVADITQKTENSLRQIEKAENDSQKRLEKVEDNTKKAVGKLDRESRLSFASLKRRAIEQVSAIFIRNNINSRFEDVLVKSESAMQEAEERLTLVLSGVPDFPEVLAELKTQIPELLTPEEQRDNLESLEGDERLDKSAIKGLDEELKKIRKSGGARGPFGVRRIYRPMVDRFADETDGAKKAFVLSKEPLETDTITVSGSDWPFELDPTVDFLVAGKTLTLQSTVDAPTAGATLVVKYYS